MQGVAGIGGGHRQAAGEAQLDAAQRLALVAPGERHVPQEGSAGVPGVALNAAVAVACVRTGRAPRHGSRAVQGANHAALLAVVDLEHATATVGQRGGVDREPLRQQGLEVEVAGAVAGLVDAPRVGRAVGLADVVHQDETPVVLRVARRRVPAPRFNGCIVENLQVGLPAAELGHVPAAPHQFQVALPAGGALPLPAAGTAHNIGSGR